MAGITSTAGGCALFQGKGIRGTPKGSKPAAYTAALFGHSMTDQRVWIEQIHIFEDDALPLMHKLAAADQHMVADVEAVPVANPLIPETYEVTVELVDAQGNPVGQGSLEPGEPVLLQRATSMLVNRLTPLGTFNAQLEGFMFALIVLKEKVRRGDARDPYEPARKTEESIEDMDYALSVYGTYHQRLAEQRAEVLALTALLTNATDEERLGLLEGQLEESLARAQTSVAVKRPSPDDFGFTREKLVAPTDVVRKLLARPEFQKAVKVAMAGVKIGTGVAGGNPGQVIEGIAKLAPEGTTAKTALDGLTSAAKGDVRGTLSAVKTLAEGSPEFAKMEERLNAALGPAAPVLDAVKAGASSPR